MTNNNEVNIKLSAGEVAEIQQAHYKVEGLKLIAQNTNLGEDMLDTLAIRLGKAQEDFTEIGMKIIEKNTKNHTGVTNWTCDFNTRIFTYTTEACVGNCKL